MKKSCQLLSLSLLLSYSCVASAIEVPAGQKIHSFSTQEGMMLGVARVSEYLHDQNITYIPVNVFTHVAYEEHSWHGQEVTSTGLVSPLSNIATYQMNQYGEYVIEACFPEPIPVNASLLFSFSDGFQQRPIDIPQYRTDRMCMNVPYLDMYISGAHINKTEYVVIIE